MRVRFAQFNDNRTTRVEKGRGGSISIKIEFVRGNLQSVEGTIDLTSERKEIERGSEAWRPS